MELIVGETAAQARKKAKAKKDKVKKNKAVQAAKTPTTISYILDDAIKVAQSHGFAVKVDRAYVWVNCSTEQFRALKQSESDFATFKFLFSFAGKRKQWMHRPLAESDIEGRKSWFIWENGVPVKLIAKAKAKAKTTPTPTPTPEQDKAINDRLDRLEALIMQTLEAK